MRQIKFRAKRIDNGEWVYGHYCQPFRVSTIMEISGKTFIIDESTLGQFTGLKDKNEVEIYEGDILQGRESTDAYGVGFMYQAVVEWDEEEGRWIAKEEDDKWSLYDFCFEEILGNVTDNKELLS